MALHGQMLEGCAIGTLVRKLALTVDFVSSLAVRPHRASHKQSGIARGIGELVSWLPGLQELIIRANKGYPAIQTDAAREAERAVFKTGLLDLRHLKKVAVEAFPGTRPSWWYDTFLPALPPSVKSLALESFIEDERDIDFGRDLRGLSQGTSASLLDLSFHRSGWSPSTDALQPSLLDSSRGLVNLEIALSLPSEEQIAHLFAADRTHRSLVLKAWRIPPVPRCRTTLQQQKNLTRISVEGGGEAFLYYLPFLPLNLLQLEFMLVITDAGRVREPFVRLLAAFELVKSCFLDSTWCSRLGHISINLALARTEPGEDELNRQLKRCEEMRTDLLSTLQRRTVQPVTNEIFWKLERSEWPG